MKIVENKQNFTDFSCFCDKIVYQLNDLAND